MFECAFCNIDSIFYGMFDIKEAIPSCSIEAAILLVRSVHNVTLYSSCLLNLMVVEWGNYFY